MNFLKSGFASSALSILSLLCRWPTFWITEHTQKLRKHSYRRPHLHL